MSPVDRSALGKSNRRKGHDAERDLADLVRDQVLQEDLAMARRRSGAAVEVAERVEREPLRVLDAGQRACLHDAVEQPAHVVTIGGFTDANGAGARINQQAD